MILFIICMIVLPWIMGLGILKLRKKTSGVHLLEVYLSGILVLMFLAEGAGCLIIKMEQDFSLYCRILGIGIAAGCVLSLLLCIREWKLVVKQLLKQLQLQIEGIRHLRLDGNKKDRETRLQWFAVVILLLLFLQIGNVFLYVPDTAGDTTVETVNAVMSSNTIFEYNPVTGEELQIGMYPVYKIASLPLLYAACCRFFSMPVEPFLHNVMPIWGIIISFWIAAGWADAFFKDKRWKKVIFLSFYSLLIIMGDYSQNTYAYHLLHESFKGAVIAAFLCLSYGGYMLYRTLTEKEWLYGCTGIALSAVGILFTRPLFLPKALVFSTNEYGKQWGVLLISVMALYLLRNRMKKKWKKAEVVFLAIALVTSVIAGNPLSCIATAFAMTEMMAVAEERKKAHIVLTGFLIAVCLTGTIFPYCAGLQKQKYIAEEEISVQNAITDLINESGEQMYLLAPDQVMEQARRKNANLRLLYGKDLWIADCNREIADQYSEEQVVLHQMMQTDYEQPDTIAALASGTKCNILVLREYMSKAAATQYGWKSAYDVTGYAVYFR